MRSLRVSGLLGLLMVAALAVCQLPTNGAQWDAQNYINWRTLKSGSSGKITGQTLTVIESENQFYGFWSRLTGSPAETAPTENRDWSKQHLVAITLGQRATSGYYVVVKGITRDNNIAVIKAVEETPLKSQYVAQVLTQPWVILQVDRTAVDFRVEWSTREAHPSIILGPGGAYIGPRDQSGAGWVGPEHQCKWSVYKRGTESNFDDQQMVVMSSEWDFRDYYRRAFDGPVPNSGNDWLSYRLIAVHLGRRETSGYGITVRNVVRNSGAGVIRAVEETPIPGQYVTRRATQPWVIIRVESTIFDYSLDIQQDLTNRKIVISGGGR